MMAFSHQSLASHRIATFSDCFFLSSLDLQWHGKHIRWPCRLHFTLDEVMIETATPRLSLLCYRTHIHDLPDQAHFWKMKYIQTFHKGSVGIYLGTVAQEIKRSNFSLVAGSVLWRWAFPHSFPGYSVSSIQPQNKRHGMLRILC